MALAYIRILRRGQQPGIDNELPGGGGYPDNALPGDQPGIDNSLPGLQPGIDNELPSPPPGIWPPPSLGNPIVPVHPDNTLPIIPGTIWPSPGGPNYPSHGLPGSQPGVDNTLPGSQPGVDNTLPSGGARPDNSLPSQTFWMIAYCPTLGWKYIAVDPSLKPGMPLPPTAQPKG